MKIIFDDDLEAQAHVVERRQKEQCHQDRVQRFGKERRNRSLFGSDIRKRGSDKPYGQRHQRRRRQPLAKEVGGSGLCSAKALDAAKGRTKSGHTPSPCLTMMPTTKAPTASSTEKT